MSNFLVATTTLSAERSLDVLARASGEVVEVLVEEGDAVREGQLLAQLDPSDARLTLAEAQAHYDNIQREYARTAELAKHGGVTDQELENQRYQIELRTIALDRSRQQLADTEVRSPITGIVGERSVNRGATISANTRLFHVLDLDPLLAVIHIPGRRPAEPARRTGRTDSGRRRRAGQRRDRSHKSGGRGGVGHRQGHRAVDGAGTDAGALVPGSFVTVLVPTETRPNAVVVPKRAILLERDQSIVYRVQDGVAVRTPVTVGLSAQDLAEITSGLSVGDAVVTVGHESLRDGAPVRAAGEPVPQTAVAAGGGGGGGGGGFDLAQIPEQRRQALVERLLANPQVKEAYDAKLKEDPDLATDQDKRLAFFREQLEAIGGPQALFGGGGGAGGGAGAAGQGAADGGAGAAGAGGQSGAGGQAAGGGQAGAGARSGGADQAPASAAAAPAAAGAGGGFSLAQCRRIAARR